MLNLFISKMVPKILKTVEKAQNKSSGVLQLQVLPPSKLPSQNKERPAHDGEICECSICKNHFSVRLITNTNASDVTYSGRNVFQCVMCYNENQNVTHSETISSTKRHVTDSYRERPVSAKNFCKLEKLVQITKKLIENNEAASNLEGKIVNIQAQLDQFNQNVTENLFQSVNEGQRTHKQPTLNERDRIKRKTRVVMFNVP